MSKETVVTLMNPTPWDPWNYHETLDYKPVVEGGERDLSGFRVEATDGSIGKIDEQAGEAGSRILVVDTGPWIFGSKVVLPAGVIKTIDLDDERVYITCTKDQVKDAPEYEADRHRDGAYLDSLGSYYGQFWQI
ncbi:PRC-barrel domain containing protein [Catellatospora sichuanensis]|uniref:PRC-barrel domain containing protein n=1 Tax=Catellatospora sichuanensis TaxID=1969805 RepID=UPI001FE5D68A|nr:PRC-barrel domain containing protein [Catellatospora sichuanensis]